jgi:RND family efflux transporter MFP subunit
MTTNTDVTTEERDNRIGSRLLKVALYGILPLVILAASTAFAARLVETGPKTERRAPTRTAHLVEVATVEAVSRRVEVEAMGTVKPSRTVEVTALVSGPIVARSANLELGGLVAAKEKLVEIDPRDYELTVTQREADVARAESDLRLEFGQQDIARREYELLGETIADEDSDLVLRGPQLAAAKAAVDTAKAALAGAELDLARTVVRAPFDGLVRGRDVDVGTRVNASTSLATLVGTDTYWIEVAVPVSRLKWIELPASADETGSRVLVRFETAWDDGVTRVGHVRRLVGDIEEQGRMARLLVEVDDPLGVKPESADAPALLLGSYVRVTIEGRQVDDVVSIPTDRVRDGDQAWVMSDDDMLEIRMLEIVHRGAEAVLVRDGLEAGDRLVLTDLSTPVNGLPLRLETDQAPEDARAER